MSRKKILRCSECDYGLYDFYYVLQNRDIVCKDCFIEHVKFAVEENPERFAEPLKIARVEVVD